MYKALSLISGGLDSLLATKLILEQGVHVEGINFFTGFTGDDDYYLKKSQQGNHGAQKICDQLGIKLHIVNVVDDFKPVLFQPKYGYGANLNPCLDCKLFMITQAKNWLENQGFDFLITGEVVGQRAKSQRKDALPLASNITNDLIVRPLSAKLLPLTLPERNGWIKRELLGDFSGRSRKPQINLAAKFGFKEFSQPAGGCVLTDGNFCKRLQDLWDHSLKQDYSLEDILLLRLGRHLRLKPNLKAVVGRDEVENNFIASYGVNHILLQAVSHPGALVLLDGIVAKDEFALMARLAAYFSQGRDAEQVEVAVTEPGSEKLLVAASPLKSADILQKWYV